MEKKQVYILAEKWDKKVKLFDIKIGSNSTVISSPFSSQQAGLPNLHLTYHQKTGNFPSSISQLRETMPESKTILRIEHNQNRSLSQLGTVMIDIEENDFSTVKSFGCANDSSTLIIPIEIFGRYITAYFYQGDQELNSHLQNSIDANEVHALIPHSDGFQISPSGHLINYSLSTVDLYDDLRLGIIILGCHKLNRAEAEKERQEWKLGKIKFAAFAKGDKRKVAET